MRRHHRNPWLEPGVDWLPLILLVLLGFALGAVAYMVVR